MLHIGLPKLKVLEAANRIRLVASGTKILFVTQNGDRDVVRAALSTGARAYVLKTETGAEPLRAVYKVLAGHDDYARSGIAGTSTRAE